jgi:hypothetical protein
MGLNLRSVLILAVLTWALRQQLFHVHGFPAIATTTFKRQNTFFRKSLDTDEIHGLNHQQQRRRHSSHKTSRPFYVPLYMSRWRGTEDVQGPDVLKSCIPYLLPLLDGELFGKYIYHQVPPLGFLDSLFIGPLSEFYNSVPFLGLLMFLAMTLGTRMNTDMNWNVRFNAQQAALIDVALVFPELIGSAFKGEDLPRYIESPCMNFVWYTYMAMVLYSIWSNVVLRKRPDQIPWISAYATTMTGPI